MEVQRLIVASVATMGVFRRYAKLTDEEKEIVKNKVKEKLQTDSSESDATENVIDDTGSKEPMEPEDSKNEAEVPVEEEGNVEVPVEEDEGESQPELLGIIDRLAQEVQQIKSDGRVDPNEVLGLFDNMMSMVTLLVNTKLPSKPRKASIAENVMVDVIASRIVGTGHGY